MTILDRNQEARMISRVIQSGSLLLDDPPCPVPRKLSQVSHRCEPTKIQLIMFSMDEVVVVSTMTEFFFHSLAAKLNIRKLI
jgi:hypothetical protein